MKRGSSKRLNRRRFLTTVAGGTIGSVAVSFGRGGRRLSAAEAVEAYIVPNFHPASCGWLDTFSVERVYCCNSYLDHLDRVRDDPTYRFVLSECDNMIAILNFKPERVPEIKQRAAEGRLELVNATFLEMSINLSGGEALIKEGVEGLRWQEQVMGISPRFAWTIDACGTHDQMGQICAGLGLEAMVYTRMNKTGSTIHWAKSPDGSRVLALCPGSYAEFGPLFRTRTRLTAGQLRQLENELKKKAETTPAGAPVLVLGGSGDYNLAPRYKGYPQEFLKQWRLVNPETRIHISTAGEYLDVILPGIQSGKIKIPTMTGGTGYTFDSFWIENPRVKTWYRRNEHGLQAAESIATVASLRSNFHYPVQDLYGAWVQMLLNMDRNSLWGSAAGMVFVSEKSWCVQDRMESVEAINKKVQSAALGALTHRGGKLAFFNTLNWERNDPLFVYLPHGKSLKGHECQVLPDGRAICAPRLAPFGSKGIELLSRGAAESGSIQLPESIETRYYTARLDPKTGALTSLKLKPSGREILGGPANVIVAEKPTIQKGEQGDFMAPRPSRLRLASSSDFEPKITFFTGPLAVIAVVESSFYGSGSCRRSIRFYLNHPRIDFEAKLQSIPNRTVVVSEFPLAEDIDEVRRGIPNGFSHAAWAKPNPSLHGWAEGIVPAVRWIDFALSGGGGVALLDQGLTGRELNGRIPVIYLYNATDKYYGYPNPWLSGAGEHRFAYALLAHQSRWEEARVPQMAWEYNSPPVRLEARDGAPAESFLQTSNNLIVQALRREGKEIEVRLIECLGLPGTANVTLNLPHRNARLTDLRGRRNSPITGGPSYSFSVRPQQIITMRFTTHGEVEQIQPVGKWDDLAPETKLAALHTYGNEKGHPPRGGGA